MMACGDSRAPAPADTHADEVVIEVDSATTLAGTISWPVVVGTGAETDAPRAVVPAVLLIAGSGPQDRDGARVELPGYAPWRDFSAALVSAGFAVLRLDDRGTGASRGRFAGATTDDFARDAAAAVSWLRRQPSIDRARIALVGHSEGAVVALLAARADPALGALVLLGAPSRSGREIARWQRQQLVSSDLARWPSTERRAVLAAAESEAEQMAAHDPWLRRWFALDPRAVATSVTRPVLLVHGDTDRQVPPEHADELAAVLRDAGADVEVRHVSDTDHLLLPDHDGDPQGYVRLADRRPRAAVIAATTHFLSIHMVPR
jgi:pimeloyl-ACP methyl ester carboxylesterase